MLSATDLAAFDREGFFRLEAAISLEAVEAAGRALDAWEASVLRAAGDGGAPEEVAFAETPSGLSVLRVNRLLERGVAPVSALLHSPLLRGLARALCGTGFETGLASLVQKRRGDGQAIRWHRDCLYDRRRGRFVSIAVYLDADAEDDGALHLLPGSQDGHVLCRPLEAEHGWNAPGVRRLAGRPGDILIHDVMLAHGSPELRGLQRRRSLYLEVMAPAVASALAESPAAPPGANYA